MKSLLERLSKEQNVDSNITLSTDEVEMLKLFFDQCYALNSLAQFKHYLGNKWKDICKPALQSLLSKLEYDEEKTKKLLNPKRF